MRRVLTPMNETSGDSRRTEAALPTAPLPSSFESLRTSGFLYRRPRNFQSNDGGGGEI